MEHNGHNLTNDERNVIGVTSQVGHYNFWCGGCRNAHHLYTVADNNGNYYDFNGDLLRPTFRWISKSGNYGYVQTKPCGEPDARQSYCRFDITDGIITYHETCSHILAGMAVEMRTRSEWGGIKFTPDIDEDGYKIHKADFEQ